MEIGGGVIFLSQALSIYRQHEEQAVRTSSLDGLRDMLDLWKTREYSHFPAWEIAWLVLTQCGQTIRNGGQISDVISEVTSRHLTRRVIRGIPRAFYEKVRRRIRDVDVNVNPNYQKPVDLDDALRVATEVIADYSRRLVVQGGTGS
jgi:hypothetical protein